MGVVEMKGRKMRKIRYINLILMITAALIVAAAAAVGVVRAEGDWRASINLEKVQAVHDLKCGGITHISKMPAEKYPKAVAPRQLAGGSR
jgi:hypothetical protein